MSERFRNFIEKAFVALGVIMSAHLGDRTKYLGASDIAGCPRKAVLSRLRPATPKTAAQLMIMALGHAIEDIVANLFTAGGCKSIKREVELAHPQFPWLKSHIDFYAETPTEIRIRELKSTKGSVDEPYDSWENQLHVQVGLAAMNSPMKGIYGSIMVVDRICGGIQEFTGYRFNKPIFDVLVAKAQKIWAAIKGEGPIPEPEAGLLCGHCPFRGDCPAHQVEEGLPVVPDEVAEMMARYADINDQQKSLKKEQDLLKDRILSYSGKRCKAVAANGFYLCVTEQRGKLSINTSMLEETYPEAYNACKKIGNPFAKLTIERRESAAV